MKKLFKIANYRCFSIVHKVEGAESRVEGGRLFTHWICINKQSCGTIQQRDQKNICQLQATDSARRV